MTPRSRDIRSRTSRGPAGRSGVVVAVVAVAAIVLVAAALFFGRGSSGPPAGTPRIPPTEKPLAAPSRSVPEPERPHVGPAEAARPEKGEREKRAEPEPPARPAAFLDDFEDGTTCGWRGEGLAVTDDDVITGRRALGITNAGQDEITIWRELDYTLTGNTVFFVALEGAGHGQHARFALVDADGREHPWTFCPRGPLKREAWVRSWMPIEGMKGIAPGTKVTKAVFTFKGTRDPKEPKRYLMDNFTVRECRDLLETRNVQEEIWGMKLTPAIPFRMPPADRKRPLVTITEKEIGIFRRHRDYRFAIFAKFDERSVREMVASYGGGWRPPRENAKHWGPTTAAIRLGAAYVIDRRPEVAKAARNILLAYARDCPTREWANGAKYGGNPHMGSMALGWLADAYDCVADSGVFTDAEKRAVEEDLLRHHALFYCITLGSSRTNIGNMPPHLLSAIVTVGFTLRDRALVDRALNSSSYGFYRYVETVPPEGIWPEGFGYHYMTLNGLLTVMLAAGRAGGVNLFSWEYRGHSMNDWIRAHIPMRMPDRRVPSRNDSRCPTGTMDLREVAALFAAAYAATKDPVYEPYLVAEDIRRSSVTDPLKCGYWFPPLEVIPHVHKGAAGAAREEKPLGSMDFPGEGICILRTNEPVERQKHLLLHYGHGAAPHKGVREQAARRKKIWHEHYDVMSVNYFAHGKLLAPDPGCGDYSKPEQDQWYRRSISHNLVVVDERDQTDYSNGELVYWADLPGLQVAEARSKSEAVGGVDMRRTVVLTPDYLLDVFSLESDEEHTYDYIWHNFGKLTVDLDMKGFPDGIGPKAGWKGRRNGYEYLKDQRIAETDGPIRATFELPREVGGLKTRFLMAGEPGTETTVVQSEGPAYMYSADVPGYMKRAPVIVCRRRAKKTRFAAVVEARPRGPEATEAKVTTVEEVAGGPEFALVSVSKGELSGMYLVNTAGGSCQYGVTSLEGRFAAIRALPVLRGPRGAAFYLVEGSMLGHGAASIRLDPPGSVAVTLLARTQDVSSIASGSEHPLRVTVSGFFEKRPALEWERGGEGEVESSFGAGKLTLTLPPRAAVRATVE